MQNLDKVTFELKHGFYLIIQKKDGSYKKADLIGDTFDEALESAKELRNWATYSWNVIAIGNYDADRKIKEEK